MAREVSVHGVTKTKKLGIISILFEINAHECELHSIMDLCDSYCCLKHTKLDRYFLCLLLIFLFQNDAPRLRQRAIYSQLSLTNLIFD